MNLEEGIEEVFLVYKGDNVPIYKLLYGFLEDNCVAFIFLQKDIGNNIYDNISGRATFYLTDSSGNLLNVRFTDIEVSQAFFTNGEACIEMKVWVPDTYANSTTKKHIDWLLDFFRKRVHYEIYKEVSF